MSAKVAGHLPYLNEDQLKALLKEYADKLLTLREQANQLVRMHAEEKQRLQAEGKKSVREKPDGQFVDDCTELLRLWKMLRPAAVRLAQYASQTIEHARIDDITDLELRLRLPEFEHHLQTLDSRTKTIAANLQELFTLIPEKGTEILQVVRSYV